MGDVLRYLPAGQLAALAGLGPLRDLDLHLLGARQVLGGDAEAAGRNLLDFRLERVALLELDVARDAVPAQPRSERLTRFDRSVSIAVLAALACVRLPADAVHRHGERCMGFDRDRTVRHGTGREALD